jgi:hypothetical protein
MAAPHLELAIGYCAESATTILSVQCQPSRTSRYRPLSIVHTPPYILQGRTSETQGYTPGLCMHLLCSRLSSASSHGIMLRWQSCTNTHQPLICCRMMTFIRWHATTGRRTGPLCASSAGCGASQSNFDQHLAGYAHMKRVKWLGEDGAAVTAHQSSDDGQAGADDNVTAASAN